MSDRESEAQPAGQDYELDTIAASLDGEDGDTPVVESEEAQPTVAPQHSQEIAAPEDDVAQQLTLDDGVEQTPTEQAPDGEQSPDAEPAPQPEETAEAEPAPQPEPVAEPAGTPATAEAAETGFLGAIDEPFVTGAPTWPFVVYEGAWAVFAAAIVLMLRDIPEGPLYADRLYAASVAVGLALTGLGPMLIIVVWLLSGGTRKGQRGSIFVSSLLKGAVATFLGVVLWIVALVVLDQLRLGSVL